jgi:hypothetical protein
MFRLHKMQAFSQLAGKLLTFQEELSFLQVVVRALKTNPYLFAMNS